MSNKILGRLQNASLDTPALQLYANFHNHTLAELHNLQMLQFVHNSLSTGSTTLHLLFIKLKGICFTTQYTH